MKQDSTENEEEARFPGIKDKAEKLISILEEYSFEDLVRSIFCINSWVVNKSALCNAFALNKALTKIEIFGTKKIDTYDDFKEFFIRIKTFLQINSMDDDICGDFGEVKLNFNDKFYSVIIGTGHSCVFGALHFLPLIAKNLNLEYILENVLEYNNFIINTLSDVNKSPYSDKNIRFELPLENFFERVKSLFNEDRFFLVNKTIVEEFSKGDITRKHFFFYKKKVYPLYNTSILVDLYSYFLSKATNKQIRDSVEHTIAYKVNNIFNSQNKDKFPICPIFCCAVDGNKGVSKHMITFVAETKKQIILVINESAYDDKSVLLEELKTIEKLHSQDKLSIITALVKGKGLKISINKELQIVLYNESTDINKDIKMRLSDKYWCCTALDLVELSCFIKDVDELGEFISWDIQKKEKTIHISDGKLSDFFLWKKREKKLSHGAYDYDFVYTHDDCKNEMILEYYKENLSQYPFYLEDTMFKEPFSYNIESHYENKFYKSKREFLCGGTGINLKNNCFIYMMNNLNLFNINNNRKQLDKINIIDQLNIELFNCYKTELEKIDIIKNKLIQISFLPFEYAIKVDNSGFTKKNNKYVFSDIYCSNHYIIRYTIKDDSLMNDLYDSKDKSIENTYFLELLEPLFEKFPSEFKELKEKIQNDFPKEKIFSLEPMNINYFISNKISSVPEFYKENLISVRKTIAEICKDLNIPKGEFFYKEATIVIRNMQISLFKEFERVLSKYDKKYIHAKALSLYSMSLITIEKNNFWIKKSPAYKNSQKYKTEVVEQIFDQKEIRDSLIYLIETNLSINNVQRGKEICSDVDFNFCLCYAQWLRILQINSDFCFFNESNVTIKIEEDYRVDIKYDEKYKEKMQQLKDRSSNIKTYEIKYDEEDKIFINKAKNAFLIDTGIEYDEFMFALQIMYAYIPTKFERKEELANVFSIKKDILIKEIISAIGKIPNIEEKIKGILKFICINTNLIRYIDDKKEEVLPIWKRLDRENRFIVKPIVNLDDSVIFSPVSLFYLSTIWLNTLVEFYPPYEKNLTNLLEVLKAWKKRYEKEIVRDVYNLFKLKNFEYVEKEVELHKRDKKGKHPIDLGDYDVIAVDKKAKIIYLIECKFLKRIGSTYEFSMQQKDFFVHGKYDEKFQRRIDYMKINFEQFFQSQNLQVDTTYSIKPFMVTNKLFYSSFKKIDFEILSFEEFKQQIK